MCCSPLKISVSGSLKITCSEKSLQIDKPKSANEPSTTGLIIKNNDDKFPMVFKIKSSAPRYFSISSGNGCVVQPKNCCELELSRWLPSSGKEREDCPCPEKEKPVCFLIVETSICQPMSPNDKTWDVPSIWNDYVLPNDITKICIPIENKLQQVKVGDADKKFTVNCFVRSQELDKPCSLRVINMWQKFDQERLCPSALVGLLTLTALGFMFGYCLQKCNR